MKNLFIKLASLSLLMTGSGLLQAQTNYRVNAFYTMNYDGSQFVRTGDSMRIFFGGNHSYADVLGVDVPQYLLNTSNGEPNLPDYPQAYTKVSLPCDSSINYGVNASATAFVDQNITITGNADANGNIIELLCREKSGGVWENSYKETYGYNSANQITEYIHQDWASGAWVNEDKEVSTYNTAGKLQEFTKRNWVSGSWDNSENYLYEYDASGNCTSAIYREPNGSVWGNIDKTTISYDANNYPISFLFADWQSSAWQESSKAEVNYNSNGDILTMLSKGKSGSIWVDENKVTYTYTGTQKSECLQETFDGTVWNKTVKNSYNYNGSGNLENMTIQQWDDPNSAWANAYKITLEYNSQHLNSALYAESWNTGGYWEKTTGSFKYKFFYESYGNTGIANLANDAAVSIYPIPASSVLNVAIDWKKPQGSTLTVYDINGRIQVLQTLEKKNHSQTQIDISALPAGSYYLKIATTEGQMAKGFQVVK